MICLNMIVKNETKVLPRCFASLYKYISYYVIVDTGSTDGTQALIKKIMDGYGIRGEVPEDPWDHNFGRSRQVALDAALAAAKREKFRWVLFIDADEELGVNDPEWHTKLVPGTSYHIEKHQSGLRYALPQLIDIRASQFRWRRPVHNYLERIGGALQWETLYSVWVIFHYGEGAKSHGVTTHQKYMRDAGILKKELEKDPQDQWAAYYLAQSYKDAGEPELALEAYQYRLTLGGWDQEMYVSYLGVANCLETLKRSEAEIVKAYLDAYDYRPQRRDALFFLVRYYRENDRNELAYMFAKHAASIPRNDDSLFVIHDAYDWPLLDDLAVSAANTGKHKEAISACKLALMSCPESERDRISANQRWSESQLGKPQEGRTVKFAMPELDGIDKEVIVICAGLAWVPWSPATLAKQGVGGSETAAIRMAEQLSKQYQVIVFCGCNAPGRYGSVIYFDNDRLDDFLSTKTPVRLWIASRYPSFLRYDLWIRETWFWMHDVDPMYDAHLIRPGTKVITLSEWQAKRHHDLDVVISSNGITPVELRNKTVPKRFVYSSSALRGLRKLLDFWPTIRDHHPTAELHLYTSFSTPYIKKNCPEFTQEMLKKIQLPGVIMHGLLQQDQLALELQKGDIWFYPTDFEETYCITAVEMQAYNVLCFYYPVAALVETIGDRGIACDDGSAIALIDEWLADRGRIEAKKKQARQWALQQTWAKVAKQWISWLKESETFSVQVFQPEIKFVDQQEALNCGFISPEADFLGKGDVTEIINQCAAHAALWQDQGDWKIVAECPVDLVRLKPYWSKIPADADLLLLGCSWFNRRDNQHHLDQISEKEGAWRRIKGLVGGRFAYAFKDLRSLLPMKRAVGNFEHDQLVIYLLDGDIVRSGEFAYCGRIVPL